MDSAQKIIWEDLESIEKKIDLGPLRNSKILLAGANGLLGFYFANLFAYLNEKRDFNIFCDCITKSQISSVSRIRSLENAKGINFIVKDLSKHSVYGESYDFVIHAVGYAAPSRFLKDPLSVIDVNYLGMKDLLESVSKNNPKCKFLYFSSSEIYGSPPDEFVPTPETYAGNSSVTNPRACYVESKRLTEVLCLIYRERFDIDIKIARLALAYGPGMTFMDERVISQFMKKAHFDKRIDMMDGGESLRCFCYLSDAVLELLHVLFYGREAIYNIGSSREETSIKDLALMIGDVMNVPVKLSDKKQGLVGAPRRVCLDVSKAESEFNIIPEVNMKTGIERTIRWAIAAYQSQNQHNT